MACASGREVVGQRPHCLNSSCAQPLPLWAAATLGSGAALPLQLHRCGLPGRSGRRLVAARIRAPISAACQPASAHWLHAPLRMAESVTRLSEIWKNFWNLWKVLWKLCKSASSDVRLPLCINLRYHWSLKVKGHLLNESAITKGNKGTISYSFKLV